MNDLEKRWDTKLQQNGLTHVLRRPVETTGLSAISLRLRE